MGHQAVNCTVGTVDWKKKFAKSKDVYVPVISNRVIPSRAQLSSRRLVSCQPRRYVEYAHFQQRRAAGVVLDFHQIRAQSKAYKRQRQRGIEEPELLKKWKVEEEDRQARQTNQAAA